MSNEEKAIDLVDSFKRSKPLIGSYILMSTDHAKQCALISVDNEYRSRLSEVEKVSDYIPCEIYSQQVIFIQKEWQKFKQIINNF
jgi:hypothetical protein